jgi:mannose-6-phosphate isomerase-like protein (cupin superfamily)
LAEERITLLDVEPIRIEEVRCPPFGSATTHGCLYVLSGEIGVWFEDHELRAGPRSLIFVPPHVVFAAGENGTRFLDIHAPVGSAVATRGVLVRTGDTAEAVEVSGNRIAYLADADETGGALGAIEFTAPRAFAGPPPHIHRGFHDIVFVLEGTLDLRLGEDARTVGEDAFVVAPPGVAHTFSNPVDEPLRFLNLYVPGGFERFFRERAAATAAGRELTSRYDWERA